MMSGIGLRYVTLAVWLVALGVYLRAVIIYPRSMWWERVTYSGPVISFIIHVVVFYLAVILNREGLLDLDHVQINSWSVALRLHGGLSLVIKEVVHILKVRLEAGPGESL